jgi:hypothetical protein
MQFVAVQRVEHDAVSAGVAKLGRLAGRRNGFGSGVGPKDAPHARHVQFAKTIHLRLGLHRDARRADGFGKIRIAFLDHHAAFDAFGELRDFAHGQRMGETEL